MRSLVIAIALALPFTAGAVDKEFKNCSMKASKMTPKKELLKTATVKEAEARKIVLDTAGPGSKITKGGIETEDGCLVYSYHVKDPAKKGLTEVYVDAGNGNVLKQAMEGSMRAAAEKPVDKTKEVAATVKEKVTDEPSTSHNKKQ